MDRHLDCVISARIISNQQRRSFFFFLRGRPKLILHALLRIDVGLAKKERMSEGSQLTRSNDVAYYKFCTTLDRPATKERFV